MLSVHFTTSANSRWFAKYNNHLVISEWYLFLLCLMFSLLLGSGWRYIKKVGRVEEMNNYITMEMVQANLNATIRPHLSVLQFNNYQSFHPCIKISNCKALW